MNTQPNIYVFTDEVDYNTQQVRAYAKAKLISQAYDDDADIVYYNIRENPNKIGLDDLSFSINCNCYLEYTDITFDEIDEQILDIYREHKNGSSYYGHCQRNPFVMIIDGVKKIKDIDDFYIYLEEICDLVEFLNIYILVLI